MLSEGSISLYADDTAISVTDSNPAAMQLKLEHVLQEISTWYRINKLAVNLQKSNLMFFGTPVLLDRMRNMELVLNGVEIKKVEVFKYLGLTLDSRLSFRDHVDYVKRKT